MRSSISINIWLHVALVYTRFTERGRVSVKLALRRRFGLTQCLEKQSPSKICLSCPDDFATRRRAFRENPRKKEKKKEIA